MFAGKCGCRTGEVVVWRNDHAAQTHRRYPSAMPARNRPPHRTYSTLGVADALAEHMRLSREHKALMREVVELRDARKIREARKAMQRTEAVYEQLKAPESTMGRSGVISHA